MTFDVYEPRKPKAVLTGPTDSASTGIPEADAHGLVAVEYNPDAVMAKPVDMVNHPPHYTSHPSGVEAIEITRHYDFAIGNAIKYLWRAGLKKDQTRSEAMKEIEDLEKAIFYINDKIAQIKKREKIG